MTSLSQHAVFQAVARHTSFSEAARELGISRSYASRMVARLEEHLGARLFVRTTRQVHLTDAGRRLLHATAGVLDTLASAEAAVQESAQVLAGPIRLTMPLEFGDKVVVPLLLRFRAQHPRVTLQIDLSNDKIDLHDGTYDLAIRGGVLEDSSLHARRLRTFRLRTVASPAYLAHRGRPHAPEALAHHDCLIYSLNRRPNRWDFVDADGHGSSVAIQGPMQSDNTAALIRAAIEGHGVSRHPDFLVDKHIENGELVDILVDHDHTEHAFFALVPSRALMPARLRALLDHLVDAL